MYFSAIISKNDVGVVSLLNVQKEQLNNERNFEMKLKEFKNYLNQFMLLYNSIYAICQGLEAFHMIINTNDTVQKQYLLINLIQNRQKTKNFH